MREFSGRYLKPLLDLRLIIGLCGATLSVVLHELFHVVTHWSEISSINILPNASTIVEVAFIPSGQYDLAFEEAIAYIITTVVLLLTVMLIYEVHDVRSKKDVAQTVITKYFKSYYPEIDELQALNHLGSLLGVKPVARHTPQNFSTK